NELAVAKAEIKRLQDELSSKEINIIKLEDKIKAMEVTKPKEEVGPSVILDKTTVEQIRKIVLNKQIHYVTISVPRHMIDFVMDKIKKGSLYEYGQNVVGKEDLIMVFGQLCSRIEDDTQTAVEMANIRPDDKKKVLALMFHRVGANRTADDVKDCRYKHADKLDTVHVPFKDI
ncbi:hypothetical protein MAR_035286, partial [Mya arenaria]